MKVCIFFVFFFYLIVPTGVVSAHPTNLDSIIVVLKSKQGNDFYNSAFTYLEDIIYNNPRFGAPILELIQDRINEENKQEYEFEVKYLEARLFHRLRKYKEASKSYLEAEFIAEKSGNHLNLVKVLIEYAYLQMMLGEYESASNKLFRARELALGLNKSEEEAKVYNGLGILNYFFNNDSLSLSFTYRARRIVQNTDNLEILCRTYEHEGLVFLRQDKLDKASEAFEIALDYRKKLGNLTHIGNLYDNFAIIARRKKDYYKALEYCELSISYKTLIHDEGGIASVKAIIGSIYLELGDYKQATAYMINSIETRLELGEIRGASIVAKRISETYEKVGDYQNALKYHKILKQLNDSLQVEKSIQNLDELTYKFELSEAEAQIKMTQAQNTVITVVAIALLGLLIFAGYIVYSLQRSKKKISLLNSELSEKNNVVELKSAELIQTNSELEKVNRDKDLLFGVIAHDLRNPLISLIGLSEILIEDADEMEKIEIVDYAKKLNISALRLHYLIENLLSWSLINLDKIEVQKENFNLRSEAEKVTGLLEGPANSKDIKLSNNIDEDIEVYADRNIISLVIRNLTSNAIKFTPQGGEVKIETIPDGDSIQIKVIDSGIGIPESKFEEIFSNTIISTAGTGKERGSGLGLMVCKKLINKQGGEISVESEIGKGSTFTIKLNKKSS
ncbi:MAG: tetratricopeptide repeat-containing sensor histidine kinase [Ignavibacteriaceae bacterium]|nr:tetratricopeptide repeat-containing sensor histidine kinase [Ignavibacteriaceae bacterium]